MACNSFTAHTREKREKKIATSMHTVADTNVCMCLLIGTHTHWCTPPHTHTRACIARAVTHKQGSWHMVYQQAQFFCHLASFSNTTTLGTRWAFVLKNVWCKCENIAEIEFHLKLANIWPLWYKYQQCNTKISFLFLLLFPLQRCIFFNL